MCIRDRRNTTDAVNQGIALASEDRKKYGLNFVWDIKKNIAVSNLDAISTAGIFISGQKEDKRSRRYFDEMHIKAPSLKTKVGTLSGGNQQKVVIARCLNAEPKLIILDEPTKGIDVGSKNEIYQLINQLAEEGNEMCIRDSACTGDWDCRKRRRDGSLKSGSRTGNIAGNASEGRYYNAKRGRGGGAHGRSSTG